MKVYKRLGLVLMALLICVSMVAVSQAQDDVPTNVPDDPGGGDAPVQFSNSIFLPMTKNTAPGGSESLIAPALAAIAAETGVAVENLSVANMAESTYPLTARSGYNFKILNKLTGELYGILLDANGARLDRVQLEQAEAAAYTARYGVYEPALADMLAAGQVPERLPVIIWLKEPEYTPPTRPDPDATFRSEAELEAVFQAADAQRAAHIAQVSSPLIARLSGMGLEAQGDTYAPVIYTTLDVSSLRTVAKWSEIDTIYLDRSDNQPEDINTPDLDIARSTINAGTVHSRGITGSGVRVGVVEVGGRAAAANPYISFTQDTTSACATASAHSTAVAGMIRSTHSTFRGIGYGSTLRVGGSCAGSSSQLQSRSTAAADWGARALNLSWGSNIGRTPGANDRFYDNMVITRWRTVVKSAGNEGSGCGGNGNVTSPGLAYNIITVGNFSDMGTVSWTGDTMSSCSSWVDPSSTNNDREKPEVAAPGTNITSLLTASPWVGNAGSGTSYAAPMVTGMSALLMQRASSLTAWPEAVKAITMASAIHNIEGSGRLSEKDGAGGIVADRADDVARKTNWTWSAQTYSCSTANNLILHTFNSPAGYRLRFVIAWDNPTSYASYASRPSADLDLQIVNASGTVVASSSSFDNTYEIVDFTTAVAGNYTVRVRKYRCDASPMYLGYAAKAHS